MAAPYFPALRQSSGSLGATTVPSAANLGGGGGGVGSMGSILQALGPLSSLLGGGGARATSPQAPESNRQALGPSDILAALGPGAFIRGSLARGALTRR